MKAYALVYKDTDGFVRKITINGQYKVYSNLTDLLTDRYNVENFLREMFEGKKVIERKGVFPFRYNKVKVIHSHKHEQILAKRMLDTLHHEECQIL